MIAVAQHLDAVPEKLLNQNVEYHFTLGTLFLIFNEHRITFGELVDSLNNFRGLWSINAIDFRPVSVSETETSPLIHP